MPETIDKNNLKDLVLDDCDFQFGEFLRSIRKSKKISIRQLANDVNITPTYLSDIEKGNNKPPDKVLLDSLIHNLHIDEFENVVFKLYDLAAKGRNDIPVDIKNFLMNNPEVISAIRNLMKNNS